MSANRWPRIVVSMRRQKSNPARATAAIKNEMSDGQITELKITELKKEFS